jgi:hypothetical protein
MQSFPKIFAIGTDYINRIFLDEVEITEKIDGSQFGFCKINGEIQMRSKGAILYQDNPTKLFEKAIDYVCSIEDLIPDNTIFYGEVLDRPKHNTLTYERVPKHNIIIFGSCDPTGKFISRYEELEKISNSLDLETVPLLYKGKIESPEELLKLLEYDSCLGSENLGEGIHLEGIVVKNYSQPFLLGGQPIPIMMGKYVTEKFKEVHREKWGKENTGIGKWQTFVDSFRTEARWEKAIQHLKESEELENSPRDIGKLLKEISNDIVSEEMDNIKNFLWKEFSGQILRSSAKGFPEYYKTRILKEGFKEGL